MASGGQRMDTRRATPLMVYVVSLVLVPLLGFGVLAGTSIRNNAQAASAAEDFEREVALRAAAVSATAAIQLKQVDLSGRAFLAELGLPVELAGAVGFDLTALGETARTRVDSAIARLRGVMIEAGRAEDLADLDAALADLEAWRETSERELSLDSATAVILGVQTQLAELVESTALSDDSADSIGTRNSRQLSAIIELTSSAQAETAGFLRAFSPDLPQFDLAALEARHVASLDGARGLLNDERLAELFDARSRVAEAPASFTNFLELGVEDVATPSVSLLAGANAVIGRIMYFVEVSAFAVVEGDVLAAEAEAAANDARSTMRWTLIAIASVALACLIFSTLVIRSLVRPLHRLRDVAQRIGGGQLGHQELPLEGPREVRSVTLAVNEMAVTLANVDEYLHAMSNEDAEAATLDWLPGEIGASMRVSVDRVSELTHRLRESESALAELARVDTLTGLPNRFSVLEHLRKEIARESTGTIGLMFIDVDGFKSVNDTHGHGVGDEVLHTLAIRLRDEVRDGDFVARLGGDEFLVVVQAGLTEKALCALGERLIQSMEQPCVVGDQLFVLSASVGVTTQRPDDDAGKMIERADAAVYQAKRRGRRRVELYDEDLQTLVGKDAEVELALRRGIASDELVLHLQPLADGQTGHVWGAEALVRWRNSEGQLIPPGQFIPIAERSGLIFELERWVVFEAARTLREWEDAGHPQLTLAINVSGRHLLDGDFGALLDQAFAAYDVPFDRLEVELTESHLLDDVDRASEVLASIRARGVRIAIDDFGTGYSSMTYLQRLPVDVVKIDRSFVAKLPDDTFGNTVVEAVIAIATSLDLDVVAEGVEERAQLTSVLAHGVSRVQGFHLAMPAPHSEVESTLYGGPLIEADVFHEAGVTQQASTPERSV